MRETRPPLFILVAIAIIALPLFGVTATSIAADISHGEQIFRKCVNCHTLEPQGRNRVGPRLSGLFGRVAGSVPDYRYSEALKASGIIWTDQTLDAYLKDAEGFVPGTKMYGGLSLPNDRADLIEYLKTATQPAGGGPPASPARP
jgi:cytochrome c